MKLAIRKGGKTRFMKPKLDTAPPLLNARKGFFRYWRPAPLVVVPVDLYLHQQGLDTSTPSGRAMFQIMGVFAEFERAMIRKRVMAGLARARQADTHLGRKFTEDTKDGTKRAPYSAVASERLRDGHRWFAE
jgi:resolvase-like protein